MREKTRHLHFLFAAIPGLLIVLMGLTGSWLAASKFLEGPLAVPVSGLSGKGIEAATGFMKTSSGGDASWSLENVEFLEGRFNGDKKVKWFDGMSGRSEVWFQQKGMWKRVPPWMLEFESGVRKLHGELLLGPKGRNLTALLGGALLVLVLTGVFLAHLDGTGSKPAWKEPDPLLRRARLNHLWIGRIATLFLAWAALTGLCITLEPAKKTLGGWLEEKAPLKKEGLKTSAKSMEQLVMSALENFPAGKIRALRPAAFEGDLHLLEIETHAGKRRFVEVDSQTGEVYRRGYWGGELLEKDLVRWHAGGLLGSVGNIVQGLAGLTPFFLVWTGFVLRRSKKNSP